MAGVSKVGDFMTGGLLPAAVRAIDPSGQADIEAMQKEHPTAAAIGSGVGLAAGLGLPGASVFKGATIGGKIGAAAGNAAINMAPFAAGAGINTFQKTGDAGLAAKRALTAEALGVGAGTALGGISEGFGAIAKAAHPILNEVDAASYGLVGRDIAKPGAEFAKKMGLNPTGYKANTGDTQLDKVMTLLRTEGGRGIAGVQRAANWVTGQYKAINQLFKDSGATVASKVPDIMASPIVQTMQNKFNPAEVESTIKALVAHVDSRIASGPKGWSDGLNFLNKQMERGIKIGGKAEGGDISEVTQNADMGEMLQDSASVVKAHMKELTGNVLKQTPGAPDMEQIDQIYGAFPSLQSELSRRIGKPMGSMAGGSESTAGLSTAAAMALGGPAGAAAMKVIGATALAPLIKRGVGAVTNQVMGRSASGLDTFFQTLAKTGGSDVAGNVARVAGEGGQVAQLPNASALPPAASTLGPAPVEPAAMPPGAQPIPNAPAGGAPPVAVTNTTPPLSSQEQAQSSFSQPTPVKPNTFNDKAIESRMEIMYRRYVQKFGPVVPFDQFKQEITTSTNGFDPMDPNTWKGMFDSPATAEKMYKGYMSLQQMNGANVEDVLNHYTRAIVRGGAGFLTSYDRGRREDEANSRAVSALAGATGRPTKEIDDRLKLIAFDRSKTPAQRMQAVADMFIEGGVDVPILHDLGLTNLHGG
jgi:hypothetical protein